MLPEIGNFALVLALVLAIIQGSLPMIGAQIGNRQLMAVAEPAAFGQFLFVAIAFAVLDGIGAFGAVAAGWLGTKDISQAFVLTVICSTAAAILSLILIRVSHKVAMAR